MFFTFHRGEQKSEGKKHNNENNSNELLGLGLGLGFIAFSI